MCFLRANTVTPQSDETISITLNSHTLGRALTDHITISQVLTAILATADWTMFFAPSTYIGSCHAYSIIYTIFSSACCNELLSKRLHMAQPESCWMLVRAHLCYAQLNAADVVVDAFILFGF